MLPDFLGIGAQRSGSTWLDHLLRSHPQIYLPTRRKEVKFFDKNFDRGRSWYEGFFPGASDNTPYRRFGEITPLYLYREPVAGRIRELLPDCQFIAVLRNPVDRAYSNYALCARDYGYQGPFEDFLRDEPTTIDKGFYAQQLARFLDLFPRERFLVLILEKAVRDVDAAANRLADFLRVDPGGFARHAEKVHASDGVKYRRAFVLARRVGVMLRNGGMDPVVNLAKRVGVTRWFGKSATKPPAMLSETRRRLLDTYRSDVERLEQLIGEDLSHWKDSPQ